MPEVQDSRMPLTALSEDEQLFRDMVRGFAEHKVKPHVMDMDRAGKLPRELIDELFALGVMGIEIPTIYGGAGANFLMAILAIEELARVDPAVAVCVDVQYAGQQCFTSLADPGATSAHFTAHGAQHRGRIRFVRVRIGQ